MGRYFKKTHEESRRLWRVVQITRTGKNSAKERKSSWSYKKFIWCVHYLRLPQLWPLFQPIQHHEDGVRNVTHFERRSGWKTEAIRFKILKVGGRHGEAITDDDDDEQQQNITNISLFSKHIHAHKPLQNLPAPLQIKISRVPTLPATDTCSPLGTTNHQRHTQTNTKSTLNK